jgi:hypothetical protein
MSKRTLSCANNVSNKIYEKTQLYDTLFSRMPSELAVEIFSKLDARDKYILRKTLEIKNIDTYINYLLPRKLSEKQRNVHLKHLPKHFYLESIVYLHITETKYYTINHMFRQEEDDENEYGVYYILYLIDKSVHGVVHGVIHGVWSN